MLRAHLFLRCSCARFISSEMVAISVEKVKLFAREKLEQFLNFAYDKQNGHVFGKTFKGWGQTIGFLLIFYSFLAALFAVHMSIFLAVTPQPGKDARPTNFGRYAYPNYPNAKIGLISVPKSFTYNGNTAHLSSSKRSGFRELVDSANQSGVPDMCLNDTINYGYDIGQPCIFFRVMKVLEWSPEAINESFSDRTMMPLSCSANTISGLDVEMMQQPDGLPLNLSNHLFWSGPRSYPYRGKGSNFITPVMGLVVNLTAINDYPVSNSFSIEITCGIDLSVVGLTNLPADPSRLYEIPRDASVSISVEL